MGGKGKRKIVGIGVVSKDFKKEVRFELGLKKRILLIQQEEGRRYGEFVQCFQGIVRRQVYRLERFYWSVVGDEFGSEFGGSKGMFLILGWDDCILWEMFELGCDLGC